MSHRRYDHHGVQPVSVVHHVVEAPSEAPHHVAKVEEAVALVTDVALRGHPLVACEGDKDRHRFRASHYNGVVTNRTVESRNNSTLRAATTALL